ncbi:MAG TPA: Gp37 family protein [Chroococcidiopsis sp.]
MNISLIEAAIVERLSPLRNAGLLVRALPNEPGEYGKVVGNGVVTVSWSVDEGQPPIGMGAIEQTIRMLWVLDIRCKNLRNGDAGAMSLRQAIYALLIGFKPPGCRKMYVQKFEFVDRQESYWHYEAIFVAPTTITEADDEETGPLLSELLFEPIEVNGEAAE